MLTTSAQFEALADGQVRPLSWQFRVSWDKAFDPSLTFFELDTSLLDGPDLLAPSDNNVVQEWDKYLYENYSGRVIDIEYQREEDVPYSVNMAIADITLNNYDNLFTRNAGGSLDAYLVPKRPIRILTGFAGENVPQFVGLTTIAPAVNYKDKTAKIHAQDFLAYLFDKPLDQTVMYEDMRTDEVLNELFQLFGLTPTQYVLDEGYNLIPFTFFEKGRKLGGAVKELMQAEMGNLYMDELGIIRFKNRDRTTPPIVYTFTKDMVNEFKESDEGTIINVVEVKSQVRRVQDTQIIYTNSGSIELLAGSNEIFLDFQDPVTGIETINAYTANSASDGSGSNQTSNVSVTGTDLFSNAVKITFNNTSGATAYITNLVIYGTPAKVTENIYIRVQDDASVAEFDEQVETIENDFLQDIDDANSLALSLITYYRDYANTIELDVKGNPALQVGDNVHVNIDSIDQDYTILKIANTYTSGRFRQIITARVFNIPTFFTLDVSLLNGEDVLAP